MKKRRPSKRERDNDEDFSLGEGASVDDAVGDGGASGNREDEAAARVLILDRNPPLRGSIKAVRITEDPVTIVRYDPNLSGSILLVPWNVLERHILSYLDHQDCMNLARSTRQWYVRMSKVACGKFAVFLWQEIEESDKKDPERGYLRQARNLESTFERLTPMAIAHYNDIGRVTWTKNFKRRTQVSKKWSYWAKFQKIILMLARIDEHGDIDSYKAYAKVNNMRLGALARAKVSRVKSVLEAFMLALSKSGYKPVRFSIKFSATFRNISIVPSLKQKYSYDDPKPVANRKYLLEGIQEAILKGDSYCIETLDIKNVGDVLVEYGLATRSSDDKK